MKSRVTKTQISTGEKVVLDEYTCDNCRTEVLSEKNDITEAFGFHGTAQEIRDHAGSGTASWFACKEECILPAIKNALQKEWES